MAEMMQVLDTIESAQLALFAVHDARMRELEKQHVACWSEMAEIASIVDENNEWRVGGYHSFGAWLEDAAPQSRSAMYVAMGLVKELKADISQKDLRQIPLGSAKVLAKMPRKLRRKPETVNNAKKRPKEFVADVQRDHPELHIETLAPRNYAFTASQSEQIDGAVEFAKLLFDVTSDEAAFEAIAVEFVQSHQEEYEKWKAGDVI